MNDRIPVKFLLEGQLHEVFLKHLNADAQSADLSALFRLYYRFRSLIPIPVRQFLQRSRNKSVEVADDWYFPSDFVDELLSVIDRLEANDFDVVHPWPDGFRSALVLTHDVETADGVALVDALAKQEEQRGFRSAWNFIPFKYNVDEGLLRDLVDRGHSIGVHGYNHDGRLFESKRMFESRVDPINESLAQFDSRGFRAPMVHRNLVWLQKLRIDHDSSCFDIDPYQAMPGGVGSLWPFIYGKFVELPYTLPQDHTLLMTLGECTPRIWIEKYEYLKAKSAMVMLITHPDYLNTTRRMDVYTDFLNRLTDEQSLWRSQPDQVADWWRERDKLVESLGNGSLQTSSGNLGRARLCKLHELFSARDQSEQLSAS